MIIFDHYLFGVVAERQNFCVQFTLFPSIYFILTSWKVEYKKKSVVKLQLELTIFFISLLSNNVFINIIIKREERRLHIYEDISGQPMSG